MSFNAVTALWIAKIFILYTFMVVILPYFVMRRLLIKRNWAQRLVITVVAGNFFYIMLVLFWGLFHVTNRYVLIASTLIIPAVLLIRMRKYVWERYLKKVWINAGRFIRRENSFRYTRRLFFRWLWTKIKALSGRAWGLLRRSFFEVVLFAACSAFLLWYFSITDHFGPRASDLVVHMSWINQVDDGVIFGNGIYPFGMHALIYYMHAVFDIPTARIVLLFGTVQTFYIFTMLLMFLKELCRFRYTPYLCYIAYAAGGYIVSDRYSRFYSTLPQEFGMIFILPCAIALVRFFRAVRDEEAEHRRMKKEGLLYTQIDVQRRWRESTLWLWVLIISFGLTLSAHFYSTIVAGLLVLAAAAAYIRYVLSPRTLRRLLVAGILSVLIPVLPMAVSFAMGTPLEGSLYWALGVMGVDTDGESEGEEVSGADIDDSKETADSGADEPDSGGGAQDAPDDGGDAQDAPDNGGDVQETPQPPLKERLAGYAVNIKNAAQDLLSALIFTSGEYLYVWLICMAVMAALIPLMWILREWEYSRYLIMMTGYTGLLLILLISGRIGLPVLLDESRSSIYFCYTALVCLSLSADGALLVLSRIVRVKRFWQAVSLLLTAAFTFNLVSAGQVRAKVAGSSALERDGAALCVFDIMEKYPDEKWTIISCNEERNMVSPMAWHYEVIDFLDSMEDYEEDDEMYVPTQYVFFFIEKRSIDYALGEFPEDTDARVSEEWASYDLPAKNGLGQYAGMNRIVVNSRMYYWAKEYQKRFPNEMKVYYEDDDFICYCIEQNEYYLNNFAIDYGYNSTGGDKG